MNNKKRKKEDGFIALTSITIMSAFFIVLFAGMFFSAAEEMERTDDKEDAIIARGLANSCVEAGLNALKKDAGYEGNDTIPVGDRECEILEVDSEGYRRIIKAKGEAEEKTKRMQVEVEVEYHPEFEILDWREVSDFTDL